jgi:WD40-like Beta Propeller Repeat
MTLCALSASWRRAGVLAVVAAGVLVVPARATPSSTNGLIAFTATGSALQVETVAADGSGRSAPLVVGRQSAWSPDGSRIAYAGTVSGISQVFVMNADGGQQTQLTHETTSPGATDPAWAPDGKQIVFARATASFATQIAVMNAAGGGETGLTAPGAARDDRPNFSPDGSRILFDSTRVGNQEVWVMNADGSAPTQLTDTPDAFSAWPNWSPDGTRIAFESSRDNLVNQSGANGAEIYVMHADGSSPVRLTHDAVSDERPVWSPDGTLIAYSRLTLTSPSHLGPVNLNVMNADGGNQHQIAAGATEPDWQAAPDSDGDGLPDGWETTGVDTPAGHLDLPAMGADPHHKDVFVELDSMAGDQISVGAVDAVQRAFADAPVSNPDGTTGIDLHVDDGPGSTMNPLTGATWGPLSEQDTIPHESLLGASVGDDYDWSAFDALRALDFSAVRAPAFHYAISAHQFDAEKHSGLSRDIGASDFIVALGPICDPVTVDCTQAAQAGTFMHELGHNLGLLHGGGDGLNYKPNYLSIMNYAFQFTGLPFADGTKKLDYSRSALPTLDERQLNEGAGFGGPAGEETVAYCPNGRLRSADLDGAFDFDCDTTISASPVQANINGDATTDGSDVFGLLAGYDDWPRLVFTGGGIGSLGASAPPTVTPDDEPPISELLADAATVNAGVLPTSPLPPVNPSPGLAPPTPTTPPRATCTLRLSSSAIALRGAKRGRLSITARCTATATLKLRAKVTSTRRIHRKRHATTVSLAATSIHAKANTTVTIKLTLPRKTLDALTHHSKTSVTLTLTVTSTGGTRTTTTKKIPHLTAQHRH